jgi:hypothetical protein
MLHCENIVPNIGEKIFPERKLCGLSPYFYIHIYVSDLYIPTIIGMPILLQEIRWTNCVGIYKSLTDI